MRLKTRLRRGDYWVLAAAGILGIASAARSFGVAGGSGRAAHGGGASGDRAARPSLAGRRRIRRALGSYRRRHHRLPSRRDALFLSARGSRQRPSRAHARPCGALLRGPEGEGCVLELLPFLRVRSLLSRWVSGGDGVRNRHERGEPLVRAPSIRRYGAIVQALYSARPPARCGHDLRGMPASAIRARRIDLRDAAFPRLLALGQTVRGGFSLRGDVLLPVRLPPFALRRRALPVVPRRGAGMAILRRRPARISHTSDGRRPAAHPVPRAPRRGREDPGTR
jgi:hypothetical protein